MRHTEAATLRILPNALPSTNRISWPTLRVRYACDRGPATRHDKIIRHYILLAIIQGESCPMQRSDTANPPQVRVAHVDTPSKAPRPTLPARALAFGAIAILAVLLALLFGYGALHQGRVFRGVSVLGQNLGGMSSQEA